MEMKSKMVMDGRTVAAAEEVEEELETMRIFVGGVGEKVTEEDLHNTFSSLGTVKGVEFVKTSGRSFAYIDFQPTSQKSLSKLFSSYNGCVWKGGRLRLEKAKEHFLVRLRREWEEDAELVRKTNDKPVAVAVAVANENKDISKKSKLLTLEKKQLQIFFPKLRKVKSVPYSGTGKHKYSFRRIEVPALPLHFCDCEEHCVSSEIAKVKQISDFEDQGGNVNEEEVNMMSSVMNKIFSRKDNSSKEGGSFNQSIDDFPADEIDDSPPNESDADQEDDADNLVINIVSGGDTKSGLKENGREANFGKHQSFNERVSKKPGVLESDESNRNEFTSTMSKKKEHPETNSKESTGLLATRPDRKESSQRLPPSLSWSGSFSISHILPGFDISRSRDKKQENNCESMEVTQDVGSIAKDAIVSTDGPSFVAQSEEVQPSTDNHLTERGRAWIHKSSWRELVGKMDNSGFSISNILPDIASKRQKLQHCNTTDTVNPFVNKQQQVTSELIVAKRKKSLVGRVERNKENDGESSKPPGGDSMRIGQACTFMRSKESEKEWTKVKAALCGALKKKTHDK